MKENNAVFSALSRKGHDYLMQGKLYAYADILKAKAILLDAEGKYVDMLKVLMLAFYIYVSGDGGRSAIDIETVDMISHANEKSGADDTAFDELYFDIVSKTTTRRHRYGVRRTLRLLKKVLKNSHRKALQE